MCECYFTFFAKIDVGLAQVKWSVGPFYKYTYIWVSMKMSVICICEDIFFPLMVMQCGLLYVMVAMSDHRIPASDIASIPFHIGYTGCFFSLVLPLKLLSTKKLI